MLLLCALVAGSTNVWADVSNGDIFERISSVSDIENGDEIIFVNQAETYACGTTQNTNNRTPVAITVTDHSYTYASSDNVQVFVVKINNDGKYGFHTGSGYIYSASSSKNYLKTNNSAITYSPSSETAWNLTVSDNVFTVLNQGNSSYYLAFNGTDYFSQYKTGQSKPYIFKKRVIVSAVSTPTFSVTGGTYTTAQSVELNCATDGATIRYTLDGTEPTESSTAYSSAIAVATTTTIKAKAFKGEDASNVATATYTILPILHEGTAADPYTVADARNAIDANTGLTDVYVSGIVYEGGSELSSGAMNYWISDDGSETDKFEIYKGKGLSGANFTATSDVLVGDVVVVYGTITKYKTTYEFSEGSQLYSLDRPVVPTILTASDEISELAYVTGKGPSAAQTFTVSGSNLTADITLALSGNFEMSLSEGSGYTNSLTLTQTAGAVAETTVYVRLKEGLEINDYAGTITLTSAGATDKTIDLTGEVTPTIVTWDLSKKSYTTETDLVTWTSSYATMTNATATGETSATNYLGGDGNNRSSSRFYKNNALTITPASGYMITSVVFTATSENYASNLKGSTWTNATAEASGTTVTVTPTDGVSAITATIGGTCGFTAVKVYYQTAAATINLAAACTDGDKCYGTYSNSSAFVVPADLTVYEVSVVDGELYMEAYATGAVVPANTGVLVAGTAGDHAVMLTTGGTSVLESDNMLRATGAGIDAAAMATADASCKFYRLTMHKGTQIGFFWGAADGAAFDVAANKAYLAVPTGQIGEVRGFNLNDGADAISEIMKNEKMSAIYDLSGRRVVKPTKGLYIVNGKKVVK